MTTRPRAILITGCSSGIGYHCAHALRARGWQADGVASLEPGRCGNDAEQTAAPVAGDLSGDDSTPD